MNYLKSISDPAQEFTWSPEGSNGSPITSAIQNWNEHSERFTGNVADTSRRRGLPGYLLHLECTEFMCSSWAAIKGTYHFPRNQTGHLLHQKDLSGTNCRFLSLLQTNNSRMNEAFQTYRVIALSGNKLVLKLILVRQYWLLERMMRSNKASEPQVVPPSPHTLRWASLVLLTAVSKSWGEARNTSWRYRPKSLEGEWL